MNELHLSALTKTGGGLVRRDVRSGAGDGFKALFNNIIQSDPSTGKGTPDNLTAITPELGEGDLSTPLEKLPKELLEKISQELSKDNAEQLDPTLQQTLDKLLNSAEQLSTEDVDNLVKEIKTLLKNPETASQVLSILEDAGLDLSTLNQLDLRKALESLPVNVREQLAALLTSDKAAPTTDNVAKALSEALGQLLQEQKKPAQKSGQQADAGDAEGETLDKFLVKSKARVVSAPKGDGQMADAGKESLRQAFNSENTTKGAQASIQAAELPPSQQVVQQVSNVMGDEVNVSAFTEAKAVQADTASLSTAKGDRADGVNALEQAKNAKNKKGLAELTAAKSNGGRDIEKSNMLRRLMAQARAHLKDGEGRFQIRLDPPELGNIRMTIENKGGVLSAAITTETEAARQTLLGSIDSLKAALADQGVNVGSLDVSTAEQDMLNKRNRRGNEEMERRYQEQQSKMVVATDRRRDTEEDVIYEEELTSVNVEV